jgi:hypothetical protein
MVLFFVPSNTQIRFSELRRKLKNGSVVSLFKEFHAGGWDVEWIKR